MLLVQTAIETLTQVLGIAQWCLPAFQSIRTARHTRATYTRPCEPQLVGDTRGQSDDERQYALVELACISFAGRRYCDGRTHGGSARGNLVGALGIRHRSANAVRSRRRGAVRSFLGALGRGRVTRGGSGHLRARQGPRHHQWSEARWSGAHSHDFVGSGLLCASALDARSVSRIGLSDGGKNAARLREYLATL